MSANQLELLKASIENSIVSSKSRRKYYEMRSFYAFISTAFLAAITTIILGINIETWANEIRIASLIITSLITFITSYNAFFNFKDLWVANNRALNQMYELRFTILFSEAGDIPIDMAKAEAFRKQYQEILNELNSSWYKARSTPSSK